MLHSHPPSDTLLHSTLERSVDESTTVYSNFKTLVASCGEWNIFVKYLDCSGAFFERAKTGVADLSASKASISVNWMDR